MSFTGSSRAAIPTTTEDSSTWRPMERRYSSRGTAGGCRLAADLSKVNLYDLMRAIGEHGCLSTCMAPDYACPWRERQGNCTVHDRLLEIQETLDSELRRHSLASILAEP